MNTLFKFIIFLLCAVSLSNCSRDKDIEGSYLSVDPILKLLPAEYVTGKKAIYINERNEQRVFTINRQPITAVPRTTGNKNYSIEQLLIRLQEIEQRKLTILLSVDPQYEEGSNRPIWSYSCLFFQAGGSFVSASFDKDGNFVPTASFSIFKPSATLLQKAFTDCYWMKLTNKETFSEIYMNFAQGLPAFRAENDELWVFDRFE
jgi:hypothetical protein